jgi:uncharacterized OB-fold protein
VSGTYLPAGLPGPAADPEGLTAPYWTGLAQGRLLVQRCTHCGTWQFGPEWICHRCLAFDPAWVEVEPAGHVYSWERVWHPVHPALAGHGPYLACVVELAQAGGVRMLGNVLGDPMQDVPIGAALKGVFEPHPEAADPFTLLQWQRVA